MLFAGMGCAVRHLCAVLHLYLCAVLAACSQARCVLDLNFDNLISADNLQGMPRRVQMPYISSVRWSAAWAPAAPSVVEDARTSRLVPPWRAAPDAPPRRQLLAAFTGSLRGQPLSVRLRTEIVKQCQRAPSGPGACIAHVETNFPIFSPLEQPAGSDAETILRRALRLKRRATFCLEPPGFSPPRKSILDSLLSGCIPVLFYPNAAYPIFMPHFWGAWSANATVRLDPQRVLGEGGRPPLDVLGALQAIPREKVRALQATIAQHAHELLYGLGAHGVRGDAIERLLSLLRREACAAGESGETRERCLRGGL
jgi:hypothetical protein